MLDEECAKGWAGCFMGLQTRGHRYIGVGTQINSGMMEPYKVLIIETSAVTRFVLQCMINADVRLNAVSIVADPLGAESKMLLLDPDVILLNLETPLGDGLAFLRNLMTTRPKPVVIVSGDDPTARAKAILALEYGALDVIQEPGLSSLENLSEASGNVCQIIRNAAETKLNSTRPMPALESCSEPFICRTETNLSSSFYVVGSSTGGSDLFREIFKSVENSVPGCVVALHMPALFTRSLAERLSALSRLVVKEATNGEYIRDNQVLIIPGDHYGTIKKDNQGYFVQLNRKEKMSRRCPVDLLFTSAAEYARENATGILLTGVGDDGVKGLLALKQMGATTIAQNAESSTVFGMPKHAVELQSAQLVLNTDEIIRYINGIEG